MAVISDNRAVGTLFASAAYTATQNSDEIEQRGYRGVRVYIVTSNPVATPSVVFAIEAYDAASGTWVALLTAAAMTTATTKTLTIYPGLTASANVTANDVLPARWRVSATHADADSITYSAGYQLLA